MKITDVEFITFTPQKAGICAEAVITFDNTLLVHHIRIISGKDGIFVAYPNSGWGYDDNGKRHYRDIVHPRTKQIREDFEKHIVDAYLDKLQKSESKTSLAKKS